MTLIEHLEAAKLKMLICGWGHDLQCRRDIAGSVCVSEALQLTMSPIEMGDELEWRAHKAVCDALVLDSSDPMGSIIKWNDYPGRTERDVLDAFDKAIELARGKADAGQQQ